jgi:hypothetical protein
VLRVSVRIGVVKHGVCVVAKRDLLKLPDDLEGNLRKLLHTPPPPHDIPGSRKAAPKPPKPKRKKQRKRSAVLAKVGTYKYEMAPVLKAGAKPKKRKSR